MTRRSFLLAVAAVPLAPFRPQKFIDLAPLHRAIAALSQSLRRLHDTLPAIRLPGERVLTVEETWTFTPRRPADARD